MRHRLVFYMCAYIYALGGYHELNFSIYIYMHLAVKELSIAVDVTRASRRQSKGHLSLCF